MNDTILHKLDEVSSSPSVKSTKSPAPLGIFIAIALVAGIAGGFLLSKLTPMNGALKTTVSQNGSVSTGGSTKVFGEKDTKMYPDEAEGTLKTGGINGEGSHHLERKGGESQNVYLTSSSIDLTSLVGKKVKVWGKTYSAQTAGWLMDVGYLEVE